MAIILPAILFFVVVFGASIPVGIVYARYTCDRLMAMTDKETHWDLFTGCYIKVNDRFIPAGSWRGEYEK